MSAPRYGVRWPDGSITGAITDRAALARAYARKEGGRAYQADENGNPLAIAGGIDIDEPEQEDHDDKF
jgi:hypothetical protein